MFVDNLCGTEKLDTFVLSIRYSATGRREVGGCKSMVKLAGIEVMDDNSAELVLDKDTALCVNVELNEVLYVCSSSEEKHTGKVCREIGARMPASSIVH